MEHKIKNILLIYNPAKQGVEKLIKKIKKKIENKKRKILVGIEPEKFINKKIDLVITIGGDGTLLKAVHFLPDPLYLGIHMGRVGFLCEVNKNEIDKAINRILEEKFDVYERDTITISFEEKNFWAINDILVRNEPAGRVMEFDLIISKIKFHYIADGILFSTPTGSTAYNLALNGTILHHNLKGFCINIIAPFNVNARPFIIPEGEKVILIAKGKTHIAKVWIDGQREIELPLNIKAEISLNKKRIKFISFKNKVKNIYKRLKEKFNF